MYRVLLVCSILLEGCATICSRTMYTISVDSNEPGTQVEIYRDNKIVEILTTPSMVDLSAHGGYFKPETYCFEFSKEGFSKDNKVVTAKLDPWYFGNILFGGLVGAIIVDPLSGAMWKFDKGCIVQGNVQSLDSVKKRKTNVKEEAL